MRAKVSGWGRTAAGYTNIIDYEEFSEISWNEKSPVISRGFGRSYGDASYTSGGTTLLMSGFNKSDIDHSTGTVRVEAGETIAGLIAKYLPMGFFVPITPGTKYVSVGGAIAADIHGKNHHKVGSFGNHVLSMTVRTPVGVFETSNSKNRELHWATIGGMGLTGVIEEAVLQMTSVETSKLAVDTYRMPNIHELMARMKILDTLRTYSVAWIDTLAKGESLGRSVLSVGEHALIHQVSSKDHVSSYTPKAKNEIQLPRWIPPKVVNKKTCALFNELWYRKTPKSRENEIQSINKFFYPLDGVTNWNTVYGSSGFVQYQFAIPDSDEDFVIKVLSIFSQKECPIFLAVLKRFGGNNFGMLSFPFKGWTLALDIPSDFANLQTILNGIDDELVHRGGRVYLAKDSRVGLKNLAKMYPRIEEFKELRAAFDPNNCIQSNLSRRLSL